MVPNFVAATDGGSFVPVLSDPTIVRPFASRVLPKRTASDIADDASSTGSDVREHVRLCLPALDSYRPSGEWLQALVAAEVPAISPRSHSSTVASAVRGLLSQFTLPALQQSVADGLCSALVAQAVSPISSPTLPPLALHAPSPALGHAIVGH